MNIDKVIERTYSGFNKRSEALAEIRNLVVTNAESELIEDILKFDESESHKSIDLRKISIIDLASTRYYSHDIDQIKSLLPLQYKDLIISYFYTGELTKNTTELLERNYINDEQFSIVVETLCTNNCVSDYKIKKVVAEGTERITESVLPNREPINSFYGLASNFELLTEIEANSIENIETSLEWLSNTKEKIVHLIGPDLITVLQQCLDPNYVFEEKKIHRAIALSKIWNCEELLSLLIKMRTSRGLPTDKETNNIYLNASTIEITTLRRPVSRHQVLRNINFVLQKLSDAMEDYNAQMATNALIELFELDPGALVWVDWSTLSDCLEFSERLVGFNVALVKLLMSEPYVKFQFPIISMSVGDGQFESALRSAVRNLKSKKLVDIANAIKLLPSKASAHLSEAILRHETALMLSSVIGYDPAWAKKLTGAKSLSFDVRATAFVRDAARAFEKAGILTKQKSDMFQTEAETALRVSFLKGRQLKGLVHVKLERSQVEFVAKFIESVTFVRNFVRNANIENSDQYTKEQSIRFSDKMTDYILISGPDDLRTTVSDSLRHGQVPNRFLVAFDKAIKMASPSIKDMSKFLKEIEYHEHPQHNIWILRCELVALIKSFNEHNLTISNNREIYRKVQATMQQKFFDLLTQANSQPAHVLDWKPDVLAHVSSFLADARQEFHACITEYISKHFGDTTPTNAFSSLGLSGLKEAMSEQLLQAMEDCLKWMDLVDENTRPSHVVFGDIVQLCLLEHNADIVKQLPINVINSERTRLNGIVVIERERQLPGRFYELLETVSKNLIGNCYKHSGLGRDARIRLEMIIGDDRLTFRSNNNVSLAQYNNLQQKISSLNQSIRRPNLEAASKDEASGFHKIAWAINREFGVLPNIHVDLQQRPKGINIIIDIKGTRMRIDDWCNTSS